MACVMKEFQCFSKDSQKGRACFQVSLANRQLRRNFRTQSKGTGVEVPSCRY